MIRKAQNSEAKLLTKISFDSKRYWGYPEEYYNIWEKELTITPEYIAEHDVYIHEENGCMTGYYSVVTLQNDIIIPDINLKIEAGTWLEHMFILRKFILKGIGTELFTHCINKYGAMAVDRLKILADPNAKDFYLKKGCMHINNYPSTIKGRTTPYLEYCFNNNTGDNNG